MLLDSEYKSENYTLRSKEILELDTNYRIYSTNYISYVILITFYNYISYNIRFTMLIYFKLKK